MKRNLEYLLQFYEADDVLRLNEVSKRLNVSMPSASEALSRLVEKGYLIKVSRGKFKISEKGKHFVQEMIWRHSVLEWTFINKLNIKDDRLCEIISYFEESLPIEIIEELCKLNGHPSKCPHGVEIPHPGRTSKNKYKYCKV